MNRAITQQLTALTALIHAADRLTYSQLVDDAHSTRTTIATKQLEVARQILDHAVHSSAAPTYPTGDQQ